MSRLAIYLTLPGLGGGQRSSATASPGSSAACTDDAGRPDQPRPS